MTTRPVEDKRGCVRQEPEEIAVTGRGTAIDFLVAMAVGPEVDPDGCSLALDGEKRVISLPGGRRITLDLERAEVEVEG